MNLSGLRICIGKGIPPVHHEGDIIHWYPEAMKTPQEIGLFLADVKKELDRIEEDEENSADDIFIYTLSPQIIGEIGRHKDFGIEYEDVLVLCPKHRPGPLLDPAEGEKGPRGVMLRNYMAHFCLTDLYLRYLIVCPQCADKSKSTIVGWRHTPHSELEERSE